jgi:Glycosyltransferase family 87
MGLSATVAAMPRASKRTAVLLGIIAKARAWILALALIAVVFVTLQRSVFAHTHTTFPIFRQSYHHLVLGQDLYAAYPAEQGTDPADRFKYSPTAALLFGPFALPPIPVGLFLWAVLFLAFTSLLRRRAATLAMVFVFPWLFHAVQSSSSNALVAALIVFAFIALERNRLRTGAALIGLGTLIKIFPIAGIAFALFTPRRARFALALALSLAALVAVPLLLASPSELAFQYQSWRGMVTFDELDLQFGRSVMSMLRNAFGVAMPNWPFQVAGTVLLLLPVALNRRRWKDSDFRLRFLCSLLVYAVIFNHQAEHPSFVIAATGLAIWFATSRKNPWRTGLFLFCLVGYEPLPFTVLWLAMQTELLLTPEPVPERRRSGSHDGILLGSQERLLGAASVSTLSAAQD